MFDNRIIADLDSFGAIPDNLGIVPEIIGENQIEFHVFNMSPQYYMIPERTSFLYKGKQIPFEKGVRCIYKFCDDKIERRKKVDIKIPKNFYQTTVDKNKHVEKDIYKYNRLLQNDFSYNLLDDEDILEMFDKDSIQEEDDKKKIARRTKTAFLAIRPGAYKADLFRYYVLYMKGGVWLDDKSILKKPLSDSYFEIDKHDGLFVGNCVRNVEIGFMVAPKDSPVHRDLLYKCLDNIEKRLYCDDPLLITGPSMAQTVLFKRPEDVRENTILYEGIKYRKFHVTDSVMLRDQRGDLIWHHKPITPGAFWELFKPNYYVRMWCKGSVYSDDNSKKEKLPLKALVNDVDYYIVLTFIGLSLAILLWLFSQLRILPGFEKEINATGRYIIH